MPTLDGWLGSGTDIAVTSAQSRAELAWRRISDRPTSITIHRRGSTLVAQTVRLEWDNTASFNQGQVVVRGVQRVTVFGIKDHATLSDTDIEKSDQFAIGSVKYDVISVMLPPGEVQAVCEASQAS